MKANLSGYYVDSEEQDKGRPPRRPDNGCRDAKRYYDYQGKCIDCPLPICFEDSRATKEFHRLIPRREKVLSLNREGKTQDEIAEILGVAQRTIHRDLKVALKATRSGRNLGDYTVKQ